MTRLAVWIAALGASALGASAANAQSMTLTSADIKEGGTIANEQVFKGFGCTGGNLSPALSWSGAPAATKSFAVSIYDPDAHLKFPGRGAAVYRWLPLGEVCRRQSVVGRPRTHEPWSVPGGVAIALGG
jgi:hypothetical protein